MITDQHNKHNSNLKVWNTVRVTKMWHRNMKWANAGWKMALIESSRGCHKLLIYLKMQHLWSAVKWGMSVGDWIWPAERDLPAVQQWPYHSFQLLHVLDNPCLPTEWPCPSPVLFCPGWTMSLHWCSLLFSFCLSVPSSAHVISSKFYFIVLSYYRNNTYLL